MLVVAKAVGFYDGKRRRVGEFFEVKDGHKASWFEAVQSAKAAPAKKEEKAAPATFSEMNKEAQAAEDKAIAAKTAAPAGKAA